MSTPVDLYTFYAAVSGFAIWAAGIRCAFERAVPTAAVMIVEEIISIMNADWLSENSKPAEIERVLVNNGLATVIEENETEMR